MDYKKKPNWKPETAFLLKIADAEDDGILYDPTTTRSLARPLLFARLIEKSVPHSLGEPCSSRARLYITPAGRTAALMVREAAE